MGRGTYESVRAERPWRYTRPVVVMSRSLKNQQVPEELAGKLQLSDASPEQAMAMLDAAGHRRVYVDGGLIIQSFLRAGLIADMVITRIPVLLGEGRSLFGTVPADISLVHEETRSFASGLVQSRYRIAR
ncbi:dihydrofolate reductase family protein [Consotaella salsifontis]|uniref:Dihydrofolate reductase n=1 Tax=Consotaella salsifontis TaxID=1365950 RepID=A0A1T4T251_9HYPH|nr:dihydrofolate reductase family protein [Consotaella salsifontis]SKA34555.1 Dihydrofolate reductase [Consotaella salsifontis]